MLAVPAHRKSEAARCSRLALAVADLGPHPALLPTDLPSSRAPTPASHTHLKSEIPLFVNSAL
jgi:hypothetical protein